MKSQLYFKNLILILIALFSIITPGYAKNGGGIKGVVIDESKAIAPFATVIVYNSSDSSIYKGETADENGVFEIENIKEGNYYLVVQMIGMGKAAKSDVKISNNQLLDLGEIILKIETNNLETITVIAEKPFIEKFVDKTVVNIENSIIQSNVSASEMLEKLPGVMVDRDGNISLKGKQGVIVLVDGKNTGLTGQSLTTFLKSLNSNNIQKVEIITNPSSKYDAAGNAGIINIIIKKNKRQGFNGTINTSYSQGRYPKVSNGFNLNYKNKWYNIFLNYSYDDRKIFTNLTLNRKFYSKDTLKEMFLTDDYITDRSKTHSPRIGLDVNISSKTSISILGTAQYLNNNTNTFDKTYNLDGNQNAIYHTEFKNESNSININYGLNTEYKHQFDSLGQEVKFNLDYSNYQNTIGQSYMTNYISPIGDNIKDDVLIGDHFDKLDIYSVRGDYTKPLKNSATMESGIKSSYVNSTNNIKFYNNSLMSDNFDSLRSSLFNYSENVNSAYLNLHKGFKKITTQFGLRLEHTISKGYQRLSKIGFSRNYIQMFPTLFIDYKLNEVHSININIGRRIDRPAFDQMNPFKIFLNPTTYLQGNPNLKPQYSYNSELTYVFKNQLYFTIGASTTKDNITEVLVQDAVTKMTNQAIINLDRFDYYSLNISYVKKIKNWWTTNTSMLGYYGVYKGTVNNVSLDKKMPSFYFNTNNSFSIKRGLSMELGFNYNYKTFYGVTVIKPMNNLSLGVQKSVLRNQGTITLNVSDILWRNYARGTTEFGSVVESWDAKRDTRTFNISFSYKFGKGQLINVRKTTGADDEKKRVR